jgi:protein-S-isoprenylcysteine O-methyltransferase Ste14
MAPNQLTQRKTEGNSSLSSKSSSGTNVKASGAVEVPFGDKFCQFIAYFTYNIPPTTKTLSLAFYANLHKSTMIFYMFGLMVYFKNFSLGCWVYLALHGSYGFFWNLKTLAFPDKTHQERMSIGSLFPLFTVLAGYWYIPYMMASGQSEQNPSYERVFWSVFVYVIGACVMMISDAQKYFCLRLKKGLIDYGMFAHTRNPNYVGEMMLYGAFAMISNRWIPWIILLTVWTCIFSLMMACKEVSFRKKEGWEQYRKRSYILLPKICSSHLLSFVCYGTALIVGVYCYQKGGVYEVVKNWN